ncbi:hypothetical protein V8E53_015618 [Lactarius tabidus]
MRRNPIEDILHSCFARMEAKINELPVKLANSSRGPNGRLRHPRTGLLLAAPNPRTRDQLVAFTAIQCTDSAQDLDLEPLVNVVVLERRRQIARYLGVDIERDEDNVMAVE